MENLIPSAPSPAGFAAPASGLGGQAAPPDASGSVPGLFLQIFLNSCAGQGAVCGEPADALSEGQGEEAAKGDDAPVGEGTAAAEGMPPAALFAAVLPADAPPAHPDAEGAASGEVSPAGSCADPAAGLRAAAVDAARTAQIAAVRAQAAPASGQAPVSAFDVSAVAPTDAPAAEQAAVPAAKPADAAAFDIRPAVKAADPVAVAAEPVSAAANDAPASGPEGNPARSRIEPAADAPHGAKAPAAPAVPGGKPSLASKEGDSETFSDAWARESARADGAPEETGAEKASFAREMPEPTASPAVAAARNAAEPVAAPRPPMPEPAAAQAQRTFHAGENAFVLTRKSDTSMEITLSPPGVGRLEIEVVLDKGVVNAYITAADPAGREAIERSLPQIVQALADEGMAIGGFTVSLKQGDAQDGNAQAGTARAGKGSGSGPFDAVAPVAARSAAARSGLVDIFV